MPGIRVLPRQSMRSASSALMSRVEISLISLPSTRTNMGSVDFGWMPSNTFALSKTMDGMAIAFQLPAHANGTYGKPGAGVKEGLVGPFLVKRRIGRPGQYWIRGQCGYVDHGSLLNDGIDA